MEVPKDHQFKSAVQYLVTHPEFSKEDINNTVKTIFENSDLLKTLDPSTLTSLKVKLIEGGVSEKDKVINLINRVYADYSGKIDKQLKSVSNELYFLQKLGNLESLENNEYLRAYQNRLTWEYDLTVNKNFASKTFLDSGLRSLYSMFDKPGDIANLIGNMKGTLENKISSLLTELKKDGISEDNLEKGLALLKSLDEILTASIDGLTILQKTASFENLYLKLDKIKYDFSKFQENISEEIVDLTGLAYLAKNEIEDSDPLKESFRTFRSMQSQLRELEGDSFNSASTARDTVADHIHVQKFIQNFSSYLSDKSELKLQKYELMLEKSNSLDHLNNIANNFVLINGQLSTHPVDQISNLMGESSDNPVCTNMIAKMISPEMFKNLLNVAEGKSSSIYKDLILITELNRFVEINVDKFDNLEIVLKLMCGYSINNDNNVDDFILAKRSFKIPLSEFSLTLEADLKLTAKDFEITDFVSPEVKVDEFKFQATNFQLLSSAVLENFSPDVKTIPIQYKKMLEKEIEMNSDLSLAETLIDKEFISCFEDACALYGTEINSDIVLIIAKFWEDKEFRDVFKKLINSIQNAQKINLEILNSGLLPTVTVDHNFAMYGTMAENYKYFVESYPDDIDKVKIMRDFLYFITNHGFIGNSQIVEDWIGLEFRSDNNTEGTISRAQNALKKAENVGQELDTEINLLIEQLKSGNVYLPDDIREVKKKIAELTRIIEYWKEGYVESQEFPLLVRNLWTPKISSTDDIRIVNRVIGLMTKEGKKLESTSTLNLEGIIPTNPTLTQRNEISILMKACDSFITQHSEFINQLDSNFEIPTEIASLLKTMNWLDQDQKRQLFSEIIRFSFDVNHNFIMNSLKI
ncbi:MAG: hypothetical protein H0W50_00545 [Parachlamydiaceae bacterium]|nr:hypothetical protein [Parachlamydiaceae bacterium]